MATRPVMASNQQSVLYRETPFSNPRDADWFMLNEPINGIVVIYSPTPYSKTPILRYVSGPNQTHLYVDVYGTTCMFTNVDEACIRGNGFQIELWPGDSLNVDWANSTMTIALATGSVKLAQGEFVWHMDIWLKGYDERIAQRMFLFARVLFSSGLIGILAMIFLMVKESRTG